MHDETDIRPDNFFETLFKRIAPELLDWLVDIFRTLKYLAYLLIFFGAFRLLRAAGVNPDYLDFLEKLDQYCIGALFGVTLIETVCAVIANLFRKYWR